MRRNFINSLITDDEWDADIVLLAVVATVIFVCYLQYKQPADKFDPEKFGQGVAYILGGGGLGYGLKRYGEKSNAGSSPSSDVPKE